MQQPSEAEQYLLDQIRAGHPDAWEQLVERYQGRLLAYARRRAPRGADPEDPVQETFYLFLRGLKDFRGTASVESYLFTILRRRLADLHRGRKVHALGEGDTADDDSAPNATAAIPAREATASWYARRDEHRDAARDALAAALWALARALQDDHAFRDLQVAELVFYAQWPNQKIAAEVAIDPGQVAVMKHRWLKRLHDRVAPTMHRRTGDTALPWDTPDALDSLLTEIWEDQRPTCPKRSTIGGYVLNTLDDDWQKYVAFHLDRVGCAVCRANLEDLQAQNLNDRAALHRRVLQSTVGFFRKV